jgi:hypothetical protein
MKRTMLVSTRLLVAAAVLVAAGAAGGSPAAKFRVKRQAPARAGVFSLSTASFSGYIDGKIRIGRVEYRLTPATTIYVVGEGVVEPGLSVQNAYVYVAGRRDGGDLLVSQVIVRRKDRGSEARSGKGEAGVLPENAPF